MTRFYEKLYFLKNGQSCRKSTGNNLPLFFENLQFFMWTFSSRTNSSAKICENLSQKYALKTKKFHLPGPAAQTLGNIEKLVIPFFVPYNPLKHYLFITILWSQYFSSYIFFSLWVTRGTKILAIFSQKSRFLAKLTARSTNLRNQLTFLHALRGCE